MMRFSPRRGVTVTWLAACLFVAAPIADAQTTGYAIKDGVPCIDDVCMGDPLHKHIDRFSWLKARALSFGNKVSYIADAKPDAFARK